MKKTIIFSLLIFSLFILSACSNQEAVNDNNENEENLNYNTMGIFPDNYQDFYSQGYNHALIKTNFGDIKVKLYGDLSPNTVNNFLNLAHIGFYDGLKFHRIIDNFMIQGGCPHTKTENEHLYGTGGPNYQFDDEFNNKSLALGSLAMANSGPNTNGSQFFIVTADSAPWLDGVHTNFGEVTEGLEVVKTIENLDTNVNNLPLEPVVIEEIEIIN